MKLEKLNLNELADAELNDREMCHILGGGTPGCCQCGCNYETSGGSSKSSNDSANNAGGLTSNPGAQPCCEDTPPPGTGVTPGIPPIIPSHPSIVNCDTWVQATTCNQ